MCRKVHIFAVVASLSARCFALGRRRLVGPNRKHPHTSPAMKKLLTILALAGAIITGAQAQALIAGWDFQTTTNGGTAVSASPATPKVYVANFGTGTLYLDGTQGSSDWFVPASGSTGTELNGFGGTAVNASNGLSTVTTSPSALALVNQTANGNFAVFKFDLTSIVDPIEITLAAQRTATGFATQTWEWSNDGTTFNLIGQLVSGSTAGSLQDSFVNSGVLTLPQFSGLSGAADAYVRVTFDGATASAGNNRIDNVQFNAVPEPSTYALLALSGAGLAAYRLRRRTRR